MLLRDLCIADVDECAQRISNCEQVCTNSDGAFNCSCLSGFVLHANGHSCSGEALCFIALLLQCVFHKMMIVNFKMLTNVQVPIFALKLVQTLLDPINVVVILATV